MGETSAGRTTADLCRRRSRAARCAAARIARLPECVDATHAALRAAPRWLVLVALVATVAGCAFMRDPMDPYGKLDHRIVTNFADAEHLTRGRHAFERARARIDRVRPGMTTAD